MKTLLFRYTAPRDMIEEPVYLSDPLAQLPQTLSALRSEEGLFFPASIRGDGVVAVLSAKKGDVLSLYEEKNVCFSGVKVTPDEEEKFLDLSIGNESFCQYHYSQKTPKPYLGPITDGEGHAFTRLAFGIREHPHQRSVFVGVGDVNGMDFWNEPETSGIVVNESIEKTTSASAFGCFQANNVWQTRDGQPVVREKTTYTVYNQTSSCRYLDMEITFCADFCDVNFGATKEAGPLGVRVRDEMRQDKGAGFLRNSYGALGEKECWGKSAHWCDYYANVKENDGTEQTMGITVFDYEKNERYPTAWHIRAYGLFAANNLFFKGGLQIKKGERLTYRFRIAFRTRSMDTEEISRRFMLYLTDNQ